MDNLEELKQINDDLPFTKFPDEIDEYTPFSDADDNINNMISRYRTLMKQGNITEANTIYQEYNLGSYIIGAKFLNKIQHMIIACERTISSVKKYFTFSINEPDGSIAQPNGYVWGKILSAQNGFKNVLLKLKESGSYINIFPVTTIDNVWKSEDSGGSETLTDVIQTLNDNKMDKENPVGTGSFSMNRREHSSVGVYSFAEGEFNTASGYCSHAEGNDTTASGDLSHAEGVGTTASGNGSHAEGNDTTASGDYSHATGSKTTASGFASSAFGIGTVTGGDANFSIGMYNERDKNLPFAIGGGKEESLVSGGYNIFSVDWTGYATAKGLKLELEIDTGVERTFTFTPKYHEYTNGTKYSGIELDGILESLAVVGKTKVSVGEFEDTSNTLCMHYQPGNECAAIGIVETGKYAIGSEIRWTSNGQMILDSYTSSSDERLKKDFDTLDKIDNVFMELEPVSFKYKYENDNNIHIGFKAQNVKNALNKNDLSEDDYAMFESVPKLHDVEELKDSDTEYQISYQEFTAWNTHMIQKVVRENESLRNELAEIRSKVDSLSR